MTHPRLLDRLAVKIYPRYLYPGQLAQTTGTLQVGIVHKSPASKPNWSITDYVKIEQGSQLRFRGLARSLKLTGDIEPLYSIFEIVKAVTPPDTSQSAHHISPGDPVVILPTDRRFVYPAPESASPPDSDSPLYYTAASDPLT